jgi:hypothetical protein
LPSPLERALTKKRPPLPQLGPPSGRAAGLGAELDPSRPGRRPAGSGYGEDDVGAGGKTRASTYKGEKPPKLAPLGAQPTDSRTAESAASSAARTLLATHGHHELSQGPQGSEWTSRRAGTKDDTARQATETQGPGNPPDTAHQPHPRHRTTNRLHPQHPSPQTSPNHNQIHPAPDQPPTAHSPNHPPPCRRPATPDSSAPLQDHTPDMERNLSRAQG